MKTTLMRVPKAFKMEVDSIAKSRKEPTTRFLAKNIGLFQRSEALASMTRKEPIMKAFEAFFGK